MTKRIQPKLSRPMGEIIDTALHTAALTVSDQALSRLWLEAKAGDDDNRVLWGKKAAEAIRNLKDYAALTGMDAEQYLRNAATRAEGHAFFLGQALAMLEEGAA